MSHWHQVSGDAVMAALHTSMEGLSAEEAERRLARYGPNLLVDGKRRTGMGMFVEQFRDFMILVLLAAAVISGLIGEATDAIAIMAIVVLNACVGFIQEYRAERAMDALRAMGAPTGSILRDGRRIAIAAADIVPGDMVILEAGAKVPADLRLLEVAHLSVDEAALTGESMPAEKVTNLLSDETLQLGDQKNMAFKGTIVTSGRGSGVVVATGMATEFGRIAILLQETGSVKTPLQRRLARFGQRLAVATLVICAVVFAGGVMRGEAPLFMFLTAVSLAVAAIPEALPAVVTIALALGAKELVRKKALVCRLMAVESLGSVTHICSDKTGTLTMNRMRVEEFYCDGIVERAPRSGNPWDVFLMSMALSSDVTTDSTGKIRGDPTEVALGVAARDAGVEKQMLEKVFPRVAEIPFDSDRKRMTTLHRDPAGGFVSVTKGASEAIIGYSAQVLTSAGPVAIESDALVDMSERMATDGLRVLAFGMRRWSTPPSVMTPDVLERDLTFLGFVGIMDPPREEASGAVETCKTAGIVPVMITGDHPLTARAVARQLGILDNDDALMTGSELATLSPQELEARIEKVRVYARVAPEQKLTIVRGLQARGEFVAMTGDGVNDAPALKQADIGVAMGMTGTDVAKEASSMILLDDNFATIVRAVREGRKIYDNIRRFVRYAVTTNSAEVWTIFLAPFFGLPVSLLPIQILWINLVTDGLPGLALAAEPEERDIMRRPPRPPQEGIFAHGMGIHVIWVGLFMAGLTIATQAWSFSSGSTHWQTMVFTVLCLSQLANVLAIRSERESLFTLGLLSNTPLLGAVILAMLLQMSTIYVPGLNGVFKTEPLSGMELAAALGVSSAVFFAVEGEKWVKRSRGDKALVLASS